MRVPVLPPAGIIARAALLSPPRSSAATASVPPSRAGSLRPSVTPSRQATVILVASIGIVINAVTAYRFASGSRHDLHLRDTFQHMTADALVSLGVVIAGALILLTGWVWVDPAISLLVTVVITVGTWGLKDSVRLALDAVPENVDPAAVKTYLNTLPGVVGVHDLHVWGMSTTETVLTARLVMREPRTNDAFYAEVCRELHDRFGVEHATLEVEAWDRSVVCGLAPDELV